MAYEMKAITSWSSRNFKLFGDSYVRTYVGCVHAHTVNTCANNRQQIIFYMHAYYVAIATYIAI